MNAGLEENGNMVGAANGKSIKSRKRSMFE